MKVIDSSGKSSLIENPSHKYAREKGGQNSPIMWIVIGFFTVLLLAVSGIAIFLFIQNNQLKSNPSQVLDEQTKQIKDSIGKLILIEDSENVSIVLVKDADQLRQENAEFYKNAKNGMYILVSPKRAILYDKDRNLIINVAPIINTPDTNTTGTVTPTTTTEVSRTTTPIVTTTTPKK